MKHIATTITKKGQITIPIEVRKALGLNPRDKVIFVLEGGEVKLKPMVSTLRAGFGAVKPRSTPENFKELRHKAQEWVVYKAEQEL